MIISEGKFFQTQCTLACDGKCEKAWGGSARPKVSFSEDDDDDIAWLADNQIGLAPVDPGTYEGNHAKPTNRKHNKWCWRECERSEIFEADQPVALAKDFTKLQYNKPCLHQNK